LKMSEAEIINHAGLDSAVFLRIYTLGYFFHKLSIFFSFFHEPCQSAMALFWSICRMLSICLTMKTSR
jgi:hypothetical protein